MIKKIKYDLDSKIYLSIVVLLLSILGLYWLLSNSFLALQIAPKNSTVYIDNVTYKVSQNGRVKATLSPGTHNIEVNAEGYISFVSNLKFVRSQKKSFRVSLVQIPASTKIIESGKFLSKGPDFNYLYYLDEAGKTIYKDHLILENDAIKVNEHLPLTNPKISGVNEIVWSPNKELALFRKTNGVYLFDFKKYDFVNQTETLWGKDIGSIAWSPDNSKIAYYSTTEKTLIFSNIPNTDLTRVANLSQMGIENPILRWSPDSQWLLVIPRNTSFDQNKIYLFNTYSRSFSEGTDTGSQLDAGFSPDSNTVIYGTYSKDPNNPVSSLVSLMKKDGSNKQAMNLRAEISKTAWKKDSKNLIVATYNDKTSKESLFGFNTENKQKTGFSVNDISGYITSVIISDDENMLIYQTGSGIYGLKIN